MHFFHALAFSLALTFAVICLGTAALMGLYATLVALVDWFRTGTIRSINWPFVLIIAVIGVVWMAVAYGLHTL